MTNTVDILQDKIELFKNEIGTRKLNIEQQKIYSAFTKKSGSKIYVSVTDCEGIRLKITLESQAEVKKILLKHYNGTTGTVTAWEILNMFNVVRYGSKNYSDGKYVYSRIFIKGGKRYRAIVKIFRDGSNAVLKSFNTKDETQKEKTPLNQPVANPEKRATAKSKSADDQ